MTSKKLTRNILIGMALGVIIGLICHPFADSYFVSTYLASSVKGVNSGLFDVVAKIFITLMKMLVIPLVLVSIICGASNAADPKSLGRAGGKTLLMYIFTTAIAITLAILFALMFQIGVGANLPSTVDKIATGEAKTISQTLIDLFTTNPFTSLADGRILQVIVFALLFGLALNMSGEAGRKIKAWYRR